MQIPWELILSFAVGLALLCLISYLLLVPMKFVWRLLAGGVMGALALGRIPYEKWLKFVWKLILLFLLLTGLLLVLAAALS